MTCWSDMIDLIRKGRYSSSTEINISGTDYRQDTALIRSYKAISHQKKVLRQKGNPMLMRKKKKLFSGRRITGVIWMTHVTDISIDQILSKLPQPKGDTIVSGSGMFSEICHRLMTPTCCDISSSLDKLKCKHAKMVISMTWIYR